MPDLSWPDLLKLVGGAAAAVGAYLSPAARRWFDARTELKKAELAARVEEARARETGAAARADAERQALDESWTSSTSFRGYLDAKFQALLDQQVAENRLLREQVGALTAKVLALQEQVDALQEQVASLSTIEEHLSAENAMLRDENQSLRAQVRAAEVKP